MSEQPLNQQDEKKIDTRMDTLEVFVWFQWSRLYQPSGDYCSFNPRWPNNYSLLVLPKVPLLFLRDTEYLTKIRNVVFDAIQHQKWVQDFKDTSSQLMIRKWSIAYNRTKCGFITSHVKWSLDHLATNPLPNVVVSIDGMQMTEIWVHVTLDQFWTCQ